MTDADLTARIVQLEQRIQRTRIGAALLALAVIAPWVIGAAGRNSSQVPDVLRTHMLVIEDSTGRTRIRLGAPMPDGRDEVGMQILSPGGAEQFGLGLRADGAVGMGFDAKPGVGSPANRERLNLGVTATGQGWIRYLDNGTRARLRISLDSADMPSVELLSWPNDHQILARALRFSGDTALEWKH